MYQNGNLHDEELYVEYEEIREGFGYSHNIQNFKCEKDGKEFILIPQSIDIEIKGKSYFIPAILIKNCSPEQIGLTDINNFYFAN